MKIKSIIYLSPFVLLFTGCKALREGYEVTGTVGYENEDGERFDASVTVRPTGKRVARTASK